MEKLSITKFNKEARIFWKSVENQETRLKYSRNKGREAFAGVLLLLIVLPEFLIYSGNIQVALLLYAGILATLSLISIFVKEQETRNVYQAFLLLPILRLINFSVPMFPEIPLLSFVFIYTSMIIPLTIVSSRQQFTHEQLGLSYKKILYYVPASVLIGLILGEGESFVIHTTQLIPDLSFISILKLTVVMVFFVGLIEEFIFRSILLTNLEKVFGSWEGLILSSLIFGLMNSCYGTPYVIFYSFFVGLLIGYIFQRTRNLPFIALIHGFISIFSFGIIPHVGHGLGIF